MARLKQKWVSSKVLMSSIARLDSNNQKSNYAQSIQEIPDGKKKKRFDKPAIGCNFGTYNSECSITSQYKKMKQRRSC